MSYRIIFLDFGCECTFVRIRSSGIFFKIRICGTPPGIKDENDSGFCHCGRLNPGYTNLVNNLPQIVHFQLLDKKFLFFEFF
jgi:hypothetical protein